MSRFAKQIMYGAVYVIFLSAIFYGWNSLFFQEPASCFDQKLNQGEVETDCGGAYCQDCAIKRLLPIQFSEVIVLPSAGGTTALVEIQNKNEAFGTSRLSYVLRFYGSSTTPIYEEQDVVAMYPSEVKYRLVVNAPIDASTVRYTVATTTLPISWQPIAQFSRPKTPLREVKLQYAPTTSSGVITGYIKNDNSFALRRVTINALLAIKSGTLVAASKTFVQDLVVGEERFFRIDVRLPETTTAQSLADPRVSVDVER